MTLVTVATNALMHVPCLQFVATVSHEMGHNNGVGHGSFGDIEYGDPWTVMGAGESTWPSSQWITATKWLWWWIEDAQVPPHPSHTSYHLPPSASRCPVVALVDLSAAPCSPHTLSIPLT
jgi:hypothetical protein